MAGSCFPSPKLIPKVVKVLKLLSEYDSSFSELDLYRDYMKYGGDKLVCSVGCGKPILGQDYGIIAKNCIANQRYDAATSVLDILSQELNMFDLFFFKAASIVLEQNPLCSSEDFFYFVRHVQCLVFVNKREAALEYLIYLLKNKELDGQSNLQMLMTEMRSSILLKNQIIDPLLKAYMGIFDYIEWARNNKGCIDDVCAKTHAEKAITCFKEAIEVPGQWDIFIIKLIEMLEFYHRFGEAEEALLKYADLNPENMNSFKYLCTFLKKQEDRQEKLMETLKVIALKSPSDSSVLDLVNIMRSTHRKKCVKLLFRFLDYPCNMNRKKAWRLLYKLVGDVLKKPTFNNLRCTRSCWAYRCDFWPHIHFNIGCLDISDVSDAKVPFFKAIVMSYFEESNHPYINAVIEKLQSVSPELSHELYRKVNHMNEFLRS